MLYITVALSAEARPFIDSFKLTRTYTLPYTVFENETVKLIVTGMGQENAMMATSAFLGHFLPKEDAMFLNAGICAAPKEFEIGEAVLAHKLTCEVPFGCKAPLSCKGHSYYPDILFEHPLSECELLCVDASQNSPLHAPTDMESYGVYKAASRFFDTHAMLFFKVVSDHFEPWNISKEDATALLAKQMDTLKNIIHAAEFVTKQKELFNPEEKALIQTIASHLTKSQGDSFYDACCYFKLHHQKPLHAECPLGISLPPTQKSSKQERSKYFEALIKTLTF